MHLKQLYTWRDWFKEDITLRGKLIQASETLCAGNWAGSAAFTRYEIGVLGYQRNPLTLWLPVATGITLSRARPGDRIIVAVANQAISIEVRSRFLRLLRHHYTASHSELRSNEF